MVVPTRDGRAVGEGGECPCCGAETAPSQDYCLECGSRLPPPGPAGDRPRRLPGLRGRPAEPLVAVLAALVVAMLAAVAVVAVQLTRDDAEQPLLVATPPPGEALEEPEAVETMLPPQTEPLAADEPEPAPAPAPPPPQQRGLISWPARTDGWTVVLASLPTGAGRSLAMARAREARDAGLQGVGVLVSSNFSSLHPGYFVVFAGVYTTQVEAEEGVPRARQAGYEAAYARRIAS